MRRLVRPASNNRSLVVAESQWPLLAQAVSMIGFGCWSQQRLHLLGWIGHEGFHFN
jgi:hypothetical protein